MGRIALLVAIDKGHAEIVDHLLSREETNVDVADNVGETPLMRA